MADQLDIGALRLSDSPHANGGMGGGRSTYIPPHMRGVPPAPADVPPPVMNGNMGDGAWNGARFADIFTKNFFNTRLSSPSVTTSATVPVAHTNGRMHQTLPHAPMVLQEAQLVPGTQPAPMLESSIPMHMEDQVVLARMEVAQVLLSVVLEMVNGVMESMSQDLPMPESSVNSLVSQTIHQNYRQASTLPITTTSQSKHQAMTFQSLYFNSLTLHLMTISYPISS